MHAWLNPQLRSLIGQVDLRPRRTGKYQSQKDRRHYPHEKFLEIVGPSLRQRLLSGAGTLTPHWVHYG
jgi:hypothetical protein